MVLAREVGRCPWKGRRPLLSRLFECCAGVRWKNCSWFDGSFLLFGLRMRLWERREDKRRDGESRLGLKRLGQDKRAVG